jgi:UDP-N-acetylglucosamine 2-epimerase (non-hydrolysing)
VIVFFYGTTAEAIKLAPVARRLTDQGVEYEQWLTLQQADTVLHALPGLGLPAPDHVLANGRGGQPLAGPADVIRWLVQLLVWMVRHGWAARRRLRQSKPSVLVVHGDTMTSVVGALLARILGADCAHVEAGLRSGDWRHPFPEELDRRIVGRLAQVHYAPSDAAAAVLAGRPGVVHTGHNTVVDAVLDRAVEAGRRDDDDPYGLVLLHRFEFLTSTALVERTLDALQQRSPLRLVLVADDQATHVLGPRLDALPKDRFRVIGKVSHEEFTGLLAGASFVVTDSGGVQEEAALLGVPTLVHRKATERGDGLGRNVVLSEWDVAALEDFLGRYEDFRRPPNTPTTSPSDIVVKDLMTRGYHS